MQHYRLCTFLLTVIVTCVPIETPASTPPPVTHQLARILLDFVHTCAPAQCEVLKRVAADPSKTVDERFLAEALLRVLHTPSPADVPRLRQLSEGAANPAIQIVAGSIRRMRHVPRPIDRARLMSVLDDAPCAVRDPSS